MPTERFETLDWVADDGGRSKAFKGRARGDCVARAIAIASGVDYEEVYDRLASGMEGRKVGRRSKPAPRSAGDGVLPKVYKPYLEELGFVWTPTMGIGTGTTVHLRANEIPMEGIVICRLSRHVVTVIDGVIHDTFDPSRDGERCVYGFWVPA